MKTWRGLKRSRDVHDCVFYQSQVFKKKLTTKKSFHSATHHPPFGKKKKQSCQC